MYAIRSYYAQEEELFQPTQFKKLSGPTVIGKIELPKEIVKSSEKPGDKKDNKRRKRKRIKKEKVNVGAPASTEKPQLTKAGENKPAVAGEPKKEAKPKRVVKLTKRPVRTEVNEVDVQKQIKDTLARLTSKGKNKGAKHRRDKRDVFTQRQEAEAEQIELEKSILKVTEFVTANELASMMSVQVNQIISTCMSLGMFVSINRNNFV